MEQFSEPLNRSAGPPQVIFRCQFQAPAPGEFNLKEANLAEWAHDTILRCRINAAFRSQVERRIDAAQRGARRNLSCAPGESARQIALAQASGDLYIDKPGASVAQLDRASDYGSEGSRFNSWRMRQCYSVRDIDYH